MYADPGSESLKVVRARGGRRPCATAVPPACSGILLRQMLALDAWNGAGDFRPLALRYGEAFRFAGGAEAHDAVAAQVDDALRLRHAPHCQPGARAQ